VRGRRRIFNVVRVLVLNNPSTWMPPAEATPVMNSACTEVLKVDSE